MDNTGDPYSRVVVVDLPFDATALHPHPLVRLVFLDRLAAILPRYPGYKHHWFERGGNRICIAVTKSAPFPVKWDEEVRVALSKRRGHLSRFDAVAAAKERYGAHVWPFDEESPNVEASPVVALRPRTKVPKKPPAKPRLVKRSFRRKK